MLIRVICNETDFGVAANVGGPVQTSHRTFDIECSESLASYLSLQDKWKSRTIIGVEIIDAKLANERTVR